MAHSLASLVSLGFLVAASAGACGGPAGTADAGPAIDADPNAPDADPDAPDANPNAPDAGPTDPDAGVPAFPYCQPTCQTAADCAQPSSLFDADNYECNDGVCRWTGCNSTTECTETYANPNYVCDTLPGNPLRTCYPTCNSPADCDLGTALYDADNYDCTAGKCQWTGCNSTPECTSTFMDPDYVCATLPGNPLAACQHRCDAAADCSLGSPLYDADNYECDAQICVWTGCNSTPECTDTLMNPDYVCR